MKACHPNTPEDLHALSGNSPYTFLGGPTAERPVRRTSFRGPAGHRQPGCGGVRVLPVKSGPARVTTNRNIAHCAFLPTRLSRLGKERLENFPQYAPPAENA